MFDADKLRLEIYVDDPWFGVRGLEPERRRKTGVLLLYWQATGIRLAWRKAEAGFSVRWIGAIIGSSKNDAAAIELPEKFIQEMLTVTCDFLERKTTSIKDIQRYAGRASWAAGIVPGLAGMLQPFWAALSDVRTEGSERNQHSHCAGRALRVPVQRVAHSLRWIAAFLGRRGSLRRKYDLALFGARPSVVITVDASPWGYGATRQHQGIYVGWMAQAISEEDIPARDRQLEDPGRRGVARAAHRHAGFRHGRARSSRLLVGLTAVQP